MAAPEELSASPPPAPEAEAPPTVAEGVQAEPPPPAAADGVQPEAPPAPPPLTPEEKYLSWRRLLDGALVAVVLLFAFELGLFPARFSDLLLHRAVGRAVAHGQFDFRSDPFTFTAEGSRWVDHSWLFGVFAYGMHQLGGWGDSALIFMKALLLAALAELMLRTARRPDRTLWLPAVCTALALLALSPRATLQPVSVSYLFLGLTLYLLDLPRRKLAGAGEGARLPGWNVRWFVPLVCALWVNVDAWFLLGPAAVALYLLGELLEGRRAPKGSVANLAAVLAVSVAACLANPYHVHAFTLPDQLGLSPAARELAGERLLGDVFASPWEEAHFIPEVNRSLAGAAYYPLALLGLVSFVVAPGSLRSWRGPVWLGFFLLSAWHGRAVPFFAVVAGPVTALNLLDASPGVTGVPADADRRRRQLVLRVLTLVVGVAVLAGGALGWLHSPLRGTDTGSDSRRLGWWTDFDPALEKSARQVADWREHKLVPEESRWFSPSPSAVNYLAWYAPGARGFFDNRLSLYPAGVATDYLAARAALAPPPKKAAGEEAPEEPPARPAGDRVFAERNVGYVLVNEGDLSRVNPVTLVNLLSHPEDWTLCYLYGGAAVFGRNGAGGPGAAAFAPIRYRASRLAFGPDVGRVDSPKDQAAPAAEASWWDALWQPEAARSADADDALMHVAMFEGRYRRYSQRLTRDRVWSLFDVVMTAGNPFGPLANGAATRLCSVDAARDPGPPSDLYLAVRSARRALLANRDDARAWLQLGKAYRDLARATREGESGVSGPRIRETRLAQMAGALARATRANPEKLEVRREAHQLLAEYFEEAGFFDLALEQRKAERDVMALRQEDTRAFDEPIERVGKELKKREDQFTLESSNKRPIRQALEARDRGLAAAALRAAEEQVKRSQEVEAEKGELGPSIGLAVQLLIQTGRFDEARDLLGGGAEQNPQALPFLVQIAAAAGDYQKADDMLAEALSRGEQAAAAYAPMVSAGVGVALLSGAAKASRATPYLDPVGFRGTVQGRPIPPLGQLVPEAAGLLMQQAEFQTLRGWLALEAGDISTAGTELKAVTRRADRDPYLRSYPSRPLAGIMLRWIETSDRR